MATRRARRMIGRRGAPLKTSHEISGAEGGIVLGTAVSEGVEVESREREFNDEVRVRHLGTADDVTSDVEH